MPKGKAKNVPKMPDPRSYTEEEKANIVAYVCIEITKKRSVTRILAEDEGMPSYSEWSRWKRESKEITDLVLRAREDALEALIEEIVEISDDATHDPYVVKRPNGTYVAKIDGDSIKRARLRIDAREKAAAMLAPMRFGTQRMDVTSGGEKISSEQNITLVENRVASILMYAQAKVEERRKLEQIIDQ